MVTPNLTFKLNVISNLSMNKRIQHKHDKEKIRKLDERVSYLIGCNDELERKIARFEQFERTCEKQWADVF